MYTWHEDKWGWLYSRVQKEEKLGLMKWWDLDGKIYIFQEQEREDPAKAVITAFVVVIIVLTPRYQYESIWVNDEKYIVCLMIPAIFTQRICIILEK